MITDILMITYDRPAYTRTTLSALLDTCDETMQVWLWHNGDDEETLAAVSSFRDHPRVHRFHHSPENVGLTTPTNWLWTEATGTYVSKIDDDCIVSPEWAQTLRRAHEDHPGFGVIGSWRFYEEDFVPRLAERKIATFPGGHKVMRNPWVQGSGYLLKRAGIDDIGILRDGESFTAWCIRLAAQGWDNGWYYPFIQEEHLDDPRSPFTGLHTDADLQRRLPLSAARRGVTTLGEWEQQMRDSALALQRTPVDPGAYLGLRGRLRSLAMQLRRRF